VYIFHYVPLLCPLSTKREVNVVNNVPHSKTESFDLDHYVTDKSLVGLFYVLGQEEKKIRTNPAARVTDLFKEVFGK
jgi:hypothetical protein